MSSRSATVGHVIMCLTTSAFLYQMDNLQSLNHYEKPNVFTVDCVYIENCKTVHDDCTDGTFTTCLSSIINFYPKPMICVIMVIKPSFFVYSLVVSLNFGCYSFCVAYSTTMDKSATIWLLQCIFVVLLKFDYLSSLHVCCRH